MKALESPVVSVTKGIVFGTGLLALGAMIGTGIGWLTTPRPVPAPAVYEARVVYQGQGCTVMREPGMETYLMRGDCHLIWPQP